MRVSRLDTRLKSQRSVKRESYAGFLRSHLESFLRRRARWLLIVIKFREPGKGPLRLKLIRSRLVPFFVADR